eukprot:5200-Heterococcus_DN1.PRE.4
MDKIQQLTYNRSTSMKANDVKRIAVVTSIGAGDSKDQAPFFFKMLMFTVMKTIFTDKNNQEQLFSSGGPGSDLEYVIVRPGGLTVDAPTGVLNIIDGEAGSIPRADVATFCLSAVTEKDFAYLRKQRACLHLTFNVTSISQSLLYAVLAISEHCYPHYSSQQLQLSSDGTHLVIKITASDLRSAASSMCCVEHVHRHHAFPQLEAQAGQRIGVLLLVVACKHVSQVLS